MAYSIETDKLDVLYQKLKPSGVTMTALLAKACGVALAQHPIMFACRCCYAPQLGFGVTRYGGSYVLAGRRNESACNGFVRLHPFF